MKEKWFRFYPKRHKLCFTLEWGNYFSPYPQIHFSLGWGSVFIDIPYNTGRDECENPRYGFYFYSVDDRDWFDSFWWCWNKKSYCYRMPWSLEWHRTSVLKRDGEWEHETSKTGSKDFYKDDWKDIIKYETYRYFYTLESGNIQVVNATIHTVEREWRPKWFKWTSLFSKKSRNIEINFDGEVGERAGSYKGGTMGCSYNLLPNETPKQCLLRMMKERKFR